MAALRHLPAMARSVIFLSTPTSATGSMWRVLINLARGSYRPLGSVQERYAAQRMDLVASEVPPTEDRLVMHNAPAHFNRDTRLSHYRFILNARDPRDLVCSQYHWQFSHPSPQESAEETAARRIAPPDRLFIGYAMYCLHFDLVAERLAAFFGGTVQGMERPQRKALERERVENLAGNRFWVGQHWPDADTAPGRHRQGAAP